MHLFILNFTTHKFTSVNAANFIPTQMDNAHFFVNLARHAAGAKEVEQNGGLSVGYCLRRESGLSVKGWMKRPMTGLEKSATIGPFATKKSCLVSEKILLVDSLGTESCRLANSLATKPFSKRTTPTRTEGDRKLLRCSAVFVGQRWKALGRLRPRRSRFPSRFLSCCGPTGRSTGLRRVVYCTCLCEVNLPAATTPGSRYLPSASLFAAI